MRTSILSRSVIAVASLAIGSVALAATPATASAPAGVTRDQVLSVINTVRAQGTGTGTDETDESVEALIAAAAPLVRPTCGVGANEEIYYVSGQTTQAGDDADGLLLDAIISPAGWDGGIDSAGAVRFCNFGALATAEASFQLAGAVAVTYVEGQVFDSSAPTTSHTKTQTLDGNVTVTATVNSTFPVATYPTSLTATGNATKTTPVTTTTKVADKKTKSEKKAAKKKYDKRLTAAEKSFKKALHKAGKSKSKKAAAKQAYSKKKASAKAAYKIATASYKIVTSTSNVTENRPFSINVTEELDN